MKFFIISVLLLIASVASAEENSVKVIGGVNTTEATYDDAPWIVSLQMYEKDFAYCGATLITKPTYIEETTNCEAWIVTTVTCVEGVPNIIATLGNINLEEEDGIKLEFDREKDIIRNVNYTKESNAYDIALIKVKLLNVTPNKTASECEAIPYLDYIQKPAVNESSYGYVNATVFGWGLKTEDGPLQKSLFQVPAPLQTDLNCANYYGSDVFHGFSMICAGAYQLGPCSYDTGSPLVCEWTKPNEPATKYLCGITSFGTGCGRSNLPGVFADVHNFEKWIAEKTSNDEDKEEEEETEDDSWF